MVEIQVIPPRRRVSKSVRILDMIEERGGMKTAEIQAELWRMSNPDTPFDKKNRGYWGTNLYGGMYYGRGLLSFFCERRNGRWRRRTDRPHWGRPWSLLRTKILQVCSRSACGLFYPATGGRPFCPACRVNP